MAGRGKKTYGRRTVTKGGAPIVQSGRYNIPQTHKVAGKGFLAGKTFDRVYQPIVITAPGGYGSKKRPMKRGYQLGPRGGVRPTSDWEVIKKVTQSALPAAAAAVGAGAAMKMIENSAMGSQISKKLPGGTNTLALLTGAGIGYLGYKYRALIAFLGGAGLAAYALVKIGTKEAKLLDAEGGDEGALPEPTESGLPSVSQTSEAPAPGAPSPASLQEGLTSLATGKALIKEGHPKDAIPHLNNALRQTKDPAVHFYIAKAYEDLGDQLNNAGKKGEAKTAFRVAMASYKTYIDQAQPSALLDEDVLESSKEFAAGKIKRIKAHSLFSKDEPSEPPTPELVSGVAISGEELAADYDDDDEDLEGDDDDEDDDIEGDDDDDDEDEE